MLVHKRQLCYNHDACILILVVFSDLTTFLRCFYSILIIAIVAFMAYINSHLATHLFTKASRPKSILIVLTIYPALVSSKFYFRKVGNHDLLTSL
jgi:hypothetical protein